ncbi:MAG: Flp pilus assembly complex ATPase component TadA, partial [Erysipelotrichaceae bacterium]|nr:Flp pilus assembly complex ATPase component TadA [Erysipelotrichaceae bacterium]
KIGFDYESGIKQIMHHDTDIIMIGEIRDDKAAKMAVRAANTGHLVVSTIHASSASSAISRMIDLGVNESHLYEMLLCIVYQLMIIDRRGEKRVIYEVMDKKEIEYFRINRKNSSSFVCVDDQIEKGIRDGVY